MNGIIRQNIDRDSQGVLQILFEGDLVQQIRMLKFHQEIEIAMLCFLVAQLRTENPHVMGPKTGSRLQNPIPVFDNANIHPGVRSRNK